MAALGDEVALEDSQKLIVAESLNFAFPLGINSCHIHINNQRKIHRRSARDEKKCPHASRSTVDEGDR